MIPMNLLRTDSFHCGQLVMSFASVRFGRAWWFAGKYCLLGYELFIIWVSVWALEHNVVFVPPKAEFMMHFSCVSLGLAALLVFEIQGMRLNDDGCVASTPLLLNAFSSLELTEPAQAVKKRTVVMITFALVKANYWLPRLL